MKNNTNIKNENNTVITADNVLETVVSNTIITADTENHVATLSVSVPEKIRNNVLKVWDNVNADDKKETLSLLVKKAYDLYKVKAIKASKNNIDFLIASRFNICFTYSADFFIYNKPAFLKLSDFLSDSDKEEYNSNILNMQASLAILASIPENQRNEKIQGVKKALKDLSALLLKNDENISTRVNNADSMVIVQSSLRTTKDGKTFELVPRTKIQSNIETVLYNKALNNTYQIKFAVDKKHTVYSIITCDNDEN